MGQRLHILAGVLTVITTVGVLSWAISDDMDESFLKNQTISYTYSENSKISNIDVGFDNGQVLMNVHTSSPMTCSEVKAILGIQSITIKNKLYIPKCVTENNILIQLTYIQDTSI